MARHYVTQPERYLHASDGPNADRYRLSVGRNIGSGERIGGDKTAAAHRRWTQLRARIRVARSLRHTSQSRQLPSRPLSSNNELRRTSTANRIEPTKNR